MTTKPTPDPVRTMFDLWAGLYRTTTNRGAIRPPVLDPKRERLIRNAINTHGPETVEAAIRGVGCSDWHMGRNPQRKKYTDLELILRDARHIEMFAGYWDDHTADPTVRDIAAVRDLGEEW